MPELPEVETIRRQLVPRVVGRGVTDAWAHPSDKFTPALGVCGARFTRLTRRGKFLLFGVEEGRELVVHLGMTGTLSTDHRPDDPYVRARWTLDDGSELTFRDVRRFGRLRLVEKGRYEGTLAVLGPEPFDPVFTPEHLWQALRRSRRAVKTQLLSQRPVAGVGNIYADEALWLAGVHPGRTRVSRAQAAELHTAILEVLQAGIDHGGTTVRDYVAPSGRTGQHQHHLRCYGRAGQPCPRCSTTLGHRIIDGRSTTWCPTCQPRR
jgi:formamidopyrimidine-DNA glycosylase